MISFSAVAFRPPGSLAGTLVCNCDAIDLPDVKSAAQISRSLRRTQELID